MSTPEENRELVRRLFAAFNDKDWATYRELIAEDVVLHEAGESHRGADAVIDFDKRFYQTHPNAAITVEDAFASGTRAAARTTITGMTASENRGEPSAENRQSSGIFYSRIEDGEFAEIWVLTD